jgi:hypothetical protein
MGLGNPCRLHLSREGCCDTSLNFTKRASQQRGVGFVHTIAETGSVNHKEAQRKNAQTLIRMSYPGFDGKD